MILLYRKMLLQYQQCNIWTLLSLVNIDKQSRAHRDYRVILIVQVRVLNHKELMLDHPV